HGPPVHPPPGDREPRVHRSSVQPRQARSGLPAGRQLIAHVLPTADRSVSLVANRQLIAPLPGGQACLPRAPGRRFPRPVRVTSVGNRQRPHHGGTHARRVRGTPTCHHPPPPPPRPPCQVHLPGPRPIRVLVPQVVAPLPPGRRRGPL